MLTELRSGALTMYGRLATATDRKIYLQWKECEGINAVAPETAALHLKNVIGRLSACGLQATYCYLSGFRPDRLNATDIPKAASKETNGIWPIIDEVLSVLPDKFLRNGELRGVEFGSSRQGYALASAYDDGVAYIYSGALNGSRRELVAKLLHELGHSTYHVMPPLDKEKLSAAHARLKYDFIGLDFTGGSEIRIQCQESFNEFIAEMHPVYVCAGKLLRAKIEAYPAGHPRKAAWQTVYDYFKQNVFDGREYE